MSNLGNQTAAGYTQGPWAQFLDQHAGTVTIISARCDGQIATVPLAGQGDANAHLIAAAPDMASALVALIRTFRERPDILRLCGFQEHAEIKAACDALNKANGTSRDD